MITGHGDDAYRYDRSLRANFSSNVWYGADVSGLLRHLAGCLDSISSYPEPDAGSLGGRIAATEGVDPRSVCVTAGATEAFYLIARAFAGCDSAIVVPAFSEYADACRMAGHRVTPLGREALLQNKLPGQSGLVWLCNPNNPDGRVLPLETVERLVADHPDRIFVLDHSYAAFASCPILRVRQAVQNSNVIVVHSMTKQYGMAGLRLGYLTASPALAARVGALRMPWAVNALAVEAGHYVLSHRDEFSAGLTQYLCEARRFREVMGRVEGITVYNSDCHFFLASLRRGRVADLKDFLMERHGLLIRDASNFDTLDDRFLRLSAQRPDQNDQLIEAIRKWIRCCN